jgi:hypothetical protein
MHSSLRRPRAAQFAFGAVALAAIGLITVPAAARTGAAGSGRAHVAAARLDGCR